MASDLLTIATSGARAARSALDITAQNIANAATQGYVRRSIDIEEVSAAGGHLRSSDISLSGVRVAGIDRNADMFRQAEVRRTSADAGRSLAELSGLENIESAIEQARPFEMLVEFEASLQSLSADPTNPSLRTAAMASADALTSSFNIASTSLDAVVEGLHFEASANVGEANVTGSELSRVNLRIARAGPGSSDRATLLDQRDSLLETLSAQADISTQFAADGSVEVRLGGSSGEIFVSGGSSATLSVTTAANGTISFAVDGAPATLNGGSLAGRQSALVAVDNARTQLDAIAVGIAATINDAQANGVNADGVTGAALFSGSGAATLSLAFTDGAGIATAPSGAAAGSADQTNLTAMQLAFEAGAHASDTNALLFDVSANVAARRVTSEALDAIASSARIALDQQSGVDLDQEAANLVRFQQAFQASARAMQIASDIFDTLLGVGR